MDKARVLRVRESEEYYTDERCHILELSNDAGDPQLSIARARVAPGIATKLHRLREAAERYVVLEGEGDVRLGDADAQHVVPGSVVHIPPGVTQSIHNTGDTDLVFLCLCTPRFRWHDYEELETD